MTVISVTQLRLRSPYYQPAFLEYAERTYDQAKQAPGNIHTTTRAQTEMITYDLLAIVPAQCSNIWRLN
jgi:hypothetical protein